MARELLKLRPKLVSLLLIIIFSGTFVPSFAAHVHSGEVLVPAQWREAHSGPQVIAVTVVVDKEWRRIFGGDAERQARHVVELAANHLRLAYIDLRFSAVASWASGDGSATLHRALRELELSHRPLPTNVILGLTASQYTGEVDGVARSRRPYVVVKHHPRHPDRDAYVLAHEIGHVFGLDHHACPDVRCIMADHKYDSREHWCSEHLEILRANRGYLQYAHEADVQL